MKYSDLPGFDAALATFLAGAQKLSDDWYNKHFPTLSKPRIEVYGLPGPRYIKIAKVDGVSVLASRHLSATSLYCFVDRTNGDILKGSWKAPVKNGVRGNILAPGNALDKVNHHGPIYLRGGMG